jgi:Amt family ammonium transporter
VRWGRNPTSEKRADWEGLADRLDRLAGLGTQGALAARLEAAIGAIEQARTEGGRRALNRHAATGMPTREPLLERMAQDHDGILGVIRFVDFDRLCAFDPSLGDHLLQNVAERLRRMLPDQRMIAHVDRAHLAIWFGPDATEALARSEMEAIEYALGEALQIGAHTVLPKTSSQIAIVRGENPAAALSRTLARLTMAASLPSQPHISATEADGRDGFAFEQDLRLAMARGELHLCYQPVVDATKGLVSGAEALMRWRHPKRGLVSPAVFIPVMEAAGLAHEFGLWALNTAVREVRRWEAQGLAGLRVAVNVSGHQLDRDDFATLVERTLSRHGLTPGALEIELTEGVAMVDCERAARLFSSVRALGVTIAIDDFGTGYSSLSTLRKLAFDKIKIDREFVTEVDRRRDSQAICHSVIALARGLGIGVLAEGIERPEEYSWLRRHGCHQFQGFYFSPPLSAAEFVAFVDNAAGLTPKLAIGPRRSRQDITERLSA